MRCSPGADALQEGGDELCLSLIAAHDMRNAGEAHVELLLLT